jgi:hypothetical protein
MDEKKREVKKSLNRRKAVLWKCGGKSAKKYKINYVFRKKA